MDVTTAIRFHPVEIALSMLLKIGLVYLLGPAAMAVILFEIILNGTAMFNHANIRLPLGLDAMLRRCWSRRTCTGCIIRCTGMSTTAIMASPCRSGTTCSAPTSHNRRRDMMQCRSGLNGRMTDQRIWAGHWPCPFAGNEPCRVEHRRQTVRAVCHGGTSRGGSDARSARRWSRAVAAVPDIGPNAATAHPIRWIAGPSACWAGLRIDHDATALFPSDGPPYAPFIRWAMETGRFFQSPTGMMVHATAGLMISIRGALRCRRSGHLDLPPGRKPLLACADRPCVTACPVGALSRRSRL